MNLSHLAYNVLGTCLFLSLFPPFLLYTLLTGRHRKSIGQRIGIYPKKLTTRINKSPRIWIHAASVGEVNVATTIIESLESLLPGCAIILSSTTSHGQALADKKLKNRAVCIYAPLDLFISVRRALSVWKPDILVCLETEIWPNWLTEAHHMGIKTALINGRISVRSIKKYLKIKPLISATLNRIDAFSMISREDVQRITMIGAPKERISINGNAKYDLPPDQTLPDLKIKMENLFNLNGIKPVFLAGSTRNTEEEIILDAYVHILKSLPETILIIAPRHVERANQVKDLAKNLGLDSQLRTDFDGQHRLREAPVVIMDTIGELSTAYSIASIVFCGGSLVPLGGQNVLEPAVWEKPVLYGPFMDDFLDAKESLEQSGGGIQIRDGDELYKTALDLLLNPEKLNKIGKLANKAVVLNQGSALKHAEIIKQLLPQ